VTSKKEQDAIIDWRTKADMRARGQRCSDEVKRGPRHYQQKPDAAGSWRAEGRAQCAGQMDVWECIQGAEDGA